MKKTKLIEVRNSKKIPQHQIAELMNMDTSCYSKRENGVTYMKIEEWEKLAKILNVPLSDIYESDDKQVFICSDHASPNFLGTNNSTNNFYPIPETLLENQQKYIIKLEEENRELKRLLENR